MHSHFVIVNIHRSDDKPNKSIMEFELINRLLSASASNPALELGIGDDCAILNSDDNEQLLVTTDTLLDGVHFLYDTDPTQQAELPLIARKSLAASLSDIAAMGGQPTTAFLNLSIPRSWNETQAEALFDAFVNSAREFEIPIAGGDTTTWNAPLAISVTMMGCVQKGNAILRSGARVDDVICVTGPLGCSINEKQFTFTPRTKEAGWLRSHFNITSMIDISDGLLADLHHILKASHVGAELIAEHIPITDDAKQMNDEKSPLEHALTDGEDFELLLTMSAQDFERYQQLTAPDASLQIIGRITEGKECWLIDQSGRRELRTAAGYVHQFRSDKR